MTVTVVPGRVGHAKAGMENKLRGSLRNGRPYVSSSANESHAKLPFKRIRRDEPGLRSTTEYADENC